MPDDQPRKDTSIPPPFDPFPNYQIPYERTVNDHDNPFVQWRRFADEQFSSFFNGVPHLFGFNPNTENKDTAEMVRRRHELEEGWRKQFEQDMEEMRQEIEKSKSQAWNAMEDAWKRADDVKEMPTNPDTPWWTRGKAATCPALNGEMDQKKAENCPAMYDTDGQPRTELDAYNGIQKAQEPFAERWNKPAAGTPHRAPTTSMEPQKKQQTQEVEMKDGPQVASGELQKILARKDEQIKILNRRLQESQLSSAEDQVKNLDAQGQVFHSPVDHPRTESQRPSRSWFSALGWDGKQKEQTQDQQRSESTASLFPVEKQPARPSRYHMFSTRRMSPFDNPDHTIPYIMLSPYSPAYLCNPAQPRLWKVQIQDSEGEALQIIRPRFSSRYYTEADEQLAKKLPWADAFEDLVSLQQTGKMVDRDYSTWRTPTTWLLDMVNRGSLGPRWGFNDEGFLTKNVDATKRLEAPSTMDYSERCKWRKGRHRALREVVEDDAATEPSRTTLSQTEADFIDNVVDKATKPLAQFPIFGSILSAADAIVSVVDAAQKDFAEEVSKAAEQGLEAQSDSGYRSSSSSSYSFQSTATSADSTDGDNPMTSRTITRNSHSLPDGSIETRVVETRRFADGSEKTDESVHVDNGPEHNLRSLWLQEVPSPRMAELTTRAKEVFEGEKKKKQTGTLVEQPDAQLRQPEEKKTAEERPRRGGGGWFWT